MINPVENSIDSPDDIENPKILFKSCITDNKELCLSVEDNGKGIPKEIIDHIFIPFYTTKETGSGIGLSLSKQIMKMNNGTILVSSEPNKSTEFTLVFNS